MHLSQIVIKLYIFLLFFYNIWEPNSPGLFLQGPHEVLPPTQWSWTGISFLPWLIAYLDFYLWQYQKMRGNIHILCVLWMFCKSLHDCFHKQSHPRSQSGLYSSQSGPYMWHLVRRDFWISEMVMFSLHSERLLKNCFLKKGFWDLCPPETAWTSIEEILDSSQIIFITSPIIGILYASLKDIYWHLSYAKYHVGMVNRIRPSRSTRLIGDISM